MSEVVIKAAQENARSGPLTAGRGNAPFLGPIRTRGRSHEALYAAAPNARSSGRQPLGGTRTKRTCRPSQPHRKGAPGGIPEREATLSTPKMNQLTRLGIDSPRGGRALGAERMIAAVSKLDDRARTRGRHIHNRRRAQCEAAQGNDETRVTGPTVGHAHPTRGQIIPGERQPRARPARQAALHFDKASP